MARRRSARMTLESPTRPAGAGARNGSDGPNSGSVARLGPWCHDHRKLVVVAWVATLLCGGAVSGAVVDSFRDEVTLPNVESRRGFDILDAEFGGQGTGQVGTIVFRADQGVDDPAVRAAMEELFARVREIPDVVRVESPYDEGGERQISSEGPEAGTIAYANIELPEDIEFTRGTEIGDEIEAAAPDIDGLRIELGGFIFAAFEEPSSELLGLAFAIVI